MRKLKLFMFIFLAFLLVGCGAQVEYKTNVNTSQQSIKINIEMTIVEDDYQHIKGGRDKLISVIKENIPKDLNFSVDEKNKNLYKFDLSFSSYQDYQSKYKAITNQDSKSVFQVSEFTDQSPFKANQKIEINDDMKYLLDWLKNALIDSGVISSEYKDKLISNQSSSYYFNDKASYKQLYEDESVVDIIQNNVNILIKKDNKIDFNLSFLISEDTSQKFSDHFEKYIKDKNIDVKLEKKSIDYEENQSIQYDLNFNDIDISSEDSLSLVNGVLGNQFLIANSESVEENSFFYNTYNQNLYLTLNMKNLFDLNKVSLGNIHVDIDGVKTIEELTMPIDEPISLDNSDYEFVVPTTYTSIEYIVIFLTFVVMIAVFLCIKKYLKKSDKNFKVNDIKNYYLQLETMVFNSLFESKIAIEDSQVVGKNFIISVINIDKVDYGKSSEMLSYMKKFLLPGGIGIGLYLMNMIWLSYLVLIPTIILIIIIVKMIYKYDSIELELSSGKRYFFVLGDNENMKKLYQQLLSILENNQDFDKKFINKIVEMEKGI